MVSQLKSTSRTMLPSLTASVIAVLIDTSVDISLAALIFSGSLASFLPQGIGLFLLGSVIFCLMATLLNAYPGMLVVPQDTTSVMIATMVAGIAIGMGTGAPPDTVFITAVVAIAISTLVTGGIFLALGFFKLGNLIRFIPYPVIGGFLAGTGWLLTSGAIEVMTGIHPGIATIPLLFTSSVLIQWLPGLVLAVVLLWLLRRYKSSWIFPGVILTAISLFYVALVLLDLSLSEAAERGLLMGPFPTGGLMPPSPLTLLDQAHWPAIIGQAGNIAIIAVIGVVSLLLNASSLELALRQELNLNHELRSNGTANLLAASVASPVGFVALGLTTLGKRIGATGRLLPFLCAILFALVLLFGTPVIELFPRSVLGGLLLYLGLGFLVEWLYDAWFKISHTDYLILLAILVTMSILGPLAGVGLGIALSAAFFVAKYSRINVVSHSLSGASYHSTVDRPFPHRLILREVGEQICILDLRGFLFFGTAQNVLEQIRQRASDTAQRSLRFVVLDFRYVSGLDSSATFSFQRMEQMAEAQDFEIVFTHLSPSLRRQLYRSGLGQDSDESGARRIHYFATRDHGVEWCENQILADEEPFSLGAQDSLEVRLSKILPASIAPSRLMKYLQRIEVETGEVLMRQGESSDELYFIESGAATVQLEHADGRTTRLRALRQGSVVGEIEYYLRSDNFASVVMSEAGVVYRLAYQDFECLPASEPELAATLHQWLAGLLAERTAENNRIIRELAE